MKKILLPAIVLVAAGCTLPAFAAHVTPEQALERLAGQPQLRKLARRTADADAKNVTTVGNLYLFGSQGSYMILPADDRACPLLAYSSDNGVEVAGNPELAYWLDFYNSELAWMAEAPAPAEYAGESASDRPQRAAIDPLTQTEWNQEAPYNELCPKVDGRGTVTGCVATAMAQVLKFYNYPAKGTGSHSYYWEPGDSTLSFDFGATTFEWDKMTDRYDRVSTAEARKAVATLMLACGVSVDMHYDVGDSGAATMKMGEALMEYFGYDRGLWMPMRDYYGLYDWENMIYGELAEGRPVLYSGSGTGGGHQFICDGYDGDGYFHFNWGWGGMSNGYFRLTALNPADLGVGGGAGGFNSGQQISLGVKPADEDSERTYIMYCTNNFIPVQQKVVLGRELSFRGDYYNFSLSALPDEAALGVKIEGTDHSGTRFVKGFGIPGMGPLYGHNGIHFRFPELAEGNYVIIPAFFDGTKWHEIPAPVGSIGSCDAVVKDGEAFLSSPKSAQVAVKDIDAPNKIYKEREFPLHFTVVNDSKSEYLGRVTPVLYNSAGTEMVAQSQYRPVDVEVGATERITDYIGKFTALKGENLVPGDYLLLFHNDEGKAVSDTVAVTLEPVPGKTEFHVTDFKVGEKEPVADKSAVRFTYTLICDEGYFTDRLHLYVFPGDGGRDVASAMGEMTYLPAGETTGGTIVADLSALENGEYQAVLYKGDGRCTDYIRFRLDDITGVTAVMTDGYAADHVIYDLQGVRHTAPLSPGIYVIDGRKVVVAD